MLSRADWFRGVPWSDVPLDLQGDIVPAHPDLPRPRLLGGSSKLAKLAEERRKKAAGAQAGQEATKGAISKTPILFWEFLSVGVAEFVHDSTKSTK